MSHRQNAFQTSARSISWIVEPFCINGAWSTRGILRSFAEREFISCLYCIEIMHKHNENGNSNEHLSEKRSGSPREGGDLKRAPRDLQLSFATCPWKLQGRPCNPARIHGDRMDRQFLSISSCRGMWPGTGLYSLSSGSAVLELSTSSTTFDVTPYSFLKHFGYIYI